MNQKMKKYHQDIWDHLDQSLKVLKANVDDSDEIPTNTSEDFGFKSLGQKNILPSSEELLPFSALNHFSILNGKSLYIAYSNDRIIIGDLQVLREFIENKEELSRDELNKKFEETIPDVVFCGFNANAKAIVATRSGSIITIDTDSFAKSQNSIELNKTVLTAKLHHNLLWILDEENDLFYFDPISNETSKTIKENVKSFDLHDDKLYLLLNAETENIQIYKGERNPKLQNTFSNAEEINEAIEEEALFPIAISFVSDNQLLLVYGNEITAEMEEVSYDQKMYIAKINEDGTEISFHESFDIAPAFGSVLRYPSFYNILLNKLIPDCEYISIMGSSCASELTIYDSKEVIQPSQDSERAVLPISQITDNDTNPTGIALDISTTGKIFEVCLGVDQIERLPLIYILNNEGNLQIVGLFHSSAIKDNKFNISNLETVLHKENRLAPSDMDNENIKEKQSLEPVPPQKQQARDIPTEEPMEKPLFGSSFGSNVENPFTIKTEGSDLASPFANLSTKTDSEDQNSTNTEFSSAPSKPFSFGQSSADQSSFGQNSFGKPTFGQSKFEQLKIDETSTEQTATTSPSFGKPAFGQSLNKQADTAASAFGKPAFGTPAFGQPSTEEANSTTSAFGKPAFDGSSTEKPSFGTPTFGQSTFGQAVSGESSFGKSMIGSSTFGHTSTAQNSFGTPTFAQSATTSTVSNAFGKPAFGATSFGSLKTESTNNDQNDSETSKPLFGFTKTDDSNKAVSEAVSETVSFGKPAFGTPSFGTSSFGNTQSSGESPFGRPTFGTSAFAQTSAKPTFTIPSGSPFGNLSKKESPFTNLSEQSKENSATTTGPQSEEKDAITTEKKDADESQTTDKEEKPEPQNESLIGSLTDRIKKSSNISSNDLKFSTFGQSSKTTTMASPSPFSSFTDKIKNPTNEPSPFSLKDNPALQLQGSAEEESDESEIAEETTDEIKEDDAKEISENEEVEINKKLVESLKLSNDVVQTKNEKEPEEEPLPEEDETDTNEGHIENQSDLELLEPEKEDESIGSDMEIIEKTESILNVDEKGMVVSVELREYTDGIMSLESFTGYPVAGGEFPKETDDESDVEEPDTRESYEDMTGIADSDREGLDEENLEDLLVSEGVQASPETVSTPMQTETPEVDDKCIPYAVPVNAGIQTTPYETSHFEIQAFEGNEQYLAEYYKPKPLSQYYTNALLKIPKLSTDPIMKSMEKTYYLIEAELSVLDDNVKNFDAFFKDQCNLELEQRTKESLPSVYTWRLSEVDRLQEIVDDVKPTCGKNSSSLDELSEEISDATVKVLKTKNEMDELKEFIYQVEYLTDSTKDNKFRNLGLHQAKMQAKLRRKMNKAHDELSSIMESLNIMKVYISKDSGVERNVLLGQMTDIKEHHEGVLANIKKLQDDIQKLSLVPVKPMDDDEKAYENLTKEDITSIDIVELGLKQNTKKELGSFFKLLHK